MRLSLSPQPHKGQGTALSMLPMCETSNFQHEVVSLQRLLGASISHSTVHLALLPTWGAGPPLGRRGTRSGPWGRQPPAAVHSCRRVKQTRTSISRSSSRPCRARSVPEAQKNVGFSSIRTETKLKPEKKGHSQCRECWGRAGPQGSLWEAQPGMGMERTPPYPSQVPHCWVQCRVGAGQRDRCWHLALYHAKHPC